MPAKGSRAPNGAQDQLLNLPDIRALAKLVHQYELSEIELERNGERLRIRRGGPAASASRAVPVAWPSEPPAAPPMAPAAPAAAAAEAESAEPTDGSVLVTSPFVGTFYRAPSPEAPPFVEAGQTVKKGQVLCIVEAMKLMNEIEAETACKVVEVLVQNAEPVEFGQPLFRVFPVA